MTFWRPRMALSCPRFALSWWIAAFAVHRATIIAFGFDGVFFWEESYRLLVAEALRSGWDVPLHDLQADPYAGGSLVFSALTAAVVPLAGASLVTLKAVALAWSALGLALWLWMTDRFFGRRAAHALGLVWLAAPPVFVVFNVVGLGSHSDTVTLAGLHWLLLLRFLHDPQRGPGRLLAWTAAAGVAIWFSYASAITVATGAAYALAAGALPVRRWPAALLGFALGFWPWIVHHIAAGGSLDVVARTFASGDHVEGRGYLANLFDLTVRGVPAALYFRNIGIPGDVKVVRELLAYPWLAVYAAAWAGVVAACVARLAASTERGVSRLGALRRALASMPELAIVSVFPLFLVVIAASNQEFNDHGVVRWLTFRILVPALPSVFFAVALAVSRAPRPLRVSVLAACALLGLVGTGQLLADGGSNRPSIEADARGLGAEAMGHLLVFKHGTDPIFGARIDALPAELRERATRGVGFSFAYLFGTRRSDVAASGLTTALLTVDPDSRHAAIEGARAAIGEGLAQVAPLAPSARRDELAAAIEKAEADPVAAPAGADLAGARAADNDPAGHDVRVAHDGVAGTGRGNGR